MVANMLSECTLIARAPCDDPEISVQPATEPVWRLDAGHPVASVTRYNNQSAEVLGAHFEEEAELLSSAHPKL